MLGTVREWLRRSFSTTEPSTPAQARGAAQAARQDRAGSIVALRHEVRRLQQDIKDATDGLDGLSGEERTVQEGRLAALERRLEDKQRELGGFQARV